MKFDIVYSSQTGDTATLAKVIRHALPIADCMYFGSPDLRKISQSLIFVGFWTSKGTCDTEVEAFLQGLRGRKVVLFGTVGFGGSDAYCEQVLRRVRQNLNRTNSVKGSFLCQGKMELSVRRRYEEMLADEDKRAQARVGIANFDRSMARPNQADCNALKKLAQRVAMGGR